MLRWKSFVQKHKNLYTKIGYAVCPALNNQKVYFNNYGFTHLLRKCGETRPTQETAARLSPIKHCKRILETFTAVHEHRVIYKNNIPAHFWAFQKRINHRDIKVVVRKIDQGKIHFFSVYSSKSPVEKLTKQIPHHDQL